MVKEFIKWYILREYYPTRKQEKINLFFNKFSFVILFSAAFIIIGFLNGIRSKIINNVNDPYINSIPCYAGQAKVTLRALQESYSNIKIHTIKFISHSIFLSKVKNSPIYLRGLLLPCDHPYFDIINKHYIKKYSKNTFCGESSKIIITKNALLDQLDYKSDFIHNSNNLNINFNEIDIVKANCKSIPVYGIVENLPFDVDFVLLDSYFTSIEIVDSLTPTNEYKSFWVIAVDSLNCNFDHLDSIGSILLIKIKQLGYKNATVYPVESQATPGCLEIELRKKISRTSFIQLLDILTNYLNLKPQYTHQIIATLSSNSKSNTVSIKRSERDDELRYFTLTMDVKHRGDVYKMKNQMERDFPGIRLEMKSIDNVYAMYEIESSIMALEYIVLIIIGLSSIVINYKTLQLHIYKHRKNISYLKTLGVPKKLFRLIYSLEAVIDTIASFLVAIGVSFALNNMLGEKGYLFSFYSIEVLMFTLLMFIFMIFIYRFSISQILKKPFREVIRNV